MNAIGGIGPPPAGIGERRSLAAPERGDPPHFFQAAPGPARLERLAAPQRVRLRGGKTAVATHRCYWMLAEVRGAGRREAGRRLNDVLLDPAGWARAGLHFRRVYDPAAAAMTVSVVPAAETRCGRGAIGCASWGGGGLPLAEVGVELIGDEGPWRNVVGMEAAHLALAVDDMYTPEHGGYRGSLGGWDSSSAFGFRPSDAEIDSARRWLAGMIEAEYVHDHG